jgi:hypothetical protein
MSSVTSMLCAFVLLAVSATAAEPAALPASKPEVRKQIVATIDAQLAAFRRHDVVVAYTYSSTTLRAQKTLRAFAAIVSANYPEIWNNTRAECGIVHDNGTVATVLVHVFATGGDASYDYELVQERGQWRVHGVLRHEPVREGKL